MGEVSSPAGGWAKSPPPHARSIRLSEISLDTGKIAACKRLKRIHVKMRVRPIIPTEDAKMLLQYYFATRALMSKQSTINLSFDASRVGGVNRMLGYISGPGGAGAWLPPQAD